MKYVFIGGAPRSGTSLVQKILSFHPKISAGPEFDNIQGTVQLFTKMKRGIKSGRQSAFFNEDEIRIIFRSFIDKLFHNRIGKNTEYISEKTPSNALAFQDLIDIDNGYKLVFVVRDPRGVIASMREVAKRAKSSKNSVKVNIGNNLIKDLTLINNYYTKANNTIKKYPKKIHIIHFENILKSPENTIRSLCKYLNIDFSPEMLDTSKKNEMSKLVENRTISAHYTSKMYDRKISKSAADRWTKIISKAEARIIEHFFANRNFDFLKLYELQRQNFKTKLRIRYVKLKHKFDLY